MIIVSMICMALSWFTSGLFVALSVFCSVEEDRREFVHNLIRAICFAAVGAVWIFIIRGRFLT